MDDKKQNDLVKEVATVRGIAASIQAMVSPTFASLKRILNSFGFDLVKKTN